VRYKAAARFSGSLDINAVLSALPISEFPAPESIVTIPSTATVKEAAAVLTRFNVLSAPVRDVTKPDSAPWEEKYLGLVDTLDVVRGTRRRMLSCVCRARTFLPLSPACDARRAAAMCFRHVIVAACLSRDVSVAAPPRGPRALIFALARV
jgi:hypothetical protein